MTDREAVPRPGGNTPALLEQEALEDHLRLLLSRLDINCVLDVGAHDGSYGRLLRSLGYEGWIVSFEPVAEAYERLLEEARNDERWPTFRVALGSRTEARKIKVTKNPFFSSFLEGNDYSVRYFGGNVDVIHEQQVAVRTLDSYRHECLQGVGDPRLFLKVDTQGWDIEVLRGSERMLGDVLALQCEVSLKPLYRGMPSFSEAVSFLGAKGFEITGLFGIIRDRKLRLIEADCVMVRPDASRPSRS